MRKRNEKNKKKMRVREREKERIEGKKTRKKECEEGEMIFFLKKF